MGLAVDGEAMAHRFRALADVIVAILAEGDIHSRETVSDLSNVGDTERPGPLETLAAEANATAGEVLRSMNESMVDGLRRALGVPLGIDESGEPSVGDNESVAEVRP
jgi:hypothetical protein